MKTVTFTDFRKNASGLFSDVEKGQVILILRHGRPIAQITSVTTDAAQTPSWKKPGLRLTGKGAGLSAAILEERDVENLF